MYVHPYTYIHICVHVSTYSRHTCVPRVDLTLPLEFVQEALTRAHLRKRVNSLVTRARVCVCVCVFVPAARLSSARCMNLKLGPSTQIQGIYPKQ